MASLLEEDVKTSLIIKEKSQGTAIGNTHQNTKRHISQVGLLLCQNMVSVHWVV